jgi:hypothetical protein
LTTLVDHMNPLARIAPEDLIKVKNPERKIKVHLILSEEDGELDDEDDGDDDDFEPEDDGDDE